MRDVTIRDYIGSEKEVSATEVRKLPEGTVVRVHSFDRYGTHQWMDMAVTIGTNKYLAGDGYDGLIKRPIKKETDRLCYTLRVTEAEHEGAD